jgi:SAM-dependent methyltransferase
MQIPEAAKAAVPDVAKDVLRPLQSVVSALVHSGDAVECPVCGGSFDTFLPFHGREGAQCPRCRTMERHRLLALFLARETDLFSGSPKRLLHVAPEWFMQKYLKEVPGIDYLSGDIASPHAMVRLDVTDLEFEDDSFDVVMCSHVLEHVDDSDQAMRELFRVMRPGGWGILDAPIEDDLEDTFEDWSVTEPADRERVFGQRDHVRLFGRSYPDLLARAGFTVEKDRYTLADGEVERFGLKPEMDHIWMCRKPA